MNVLPFWLEGLSLNTSCKRGSLCWDEKFKINQQGNIQRLLIFDLGLEGPFPERITMISTLVEVNCSYNFLEGSIPLALFNLCHLRLLFLNNNKLSGEIPPDIGRLKKLSKLDLSSNVFSGSIPDSISCLRNLELLYLADNKFHGIIPPQIGSLGKLRELHVHKNGFSGCLPFSIGDMKALETLYYWDTRILETLPLSIGNLTGLKYLNLFPPQNHSEWKSMNTLYLKVVLLYIVNQSSYNNHSSTALNLILPELLYALG